MQAAASWGVDVLKAEAKWKKRLEEEETKEEASSKNSSPSKALRDGDSGVDYKGKGKYYSGVIKWPNSTARSTSTTGRGQGNVPSRGSDYGPPPTRGGSAEGGHESASNYKGQGTSIQGASSVITETAVDIKYHDGDKERGGDDPQNPFGRRQSRRCGGSTSSKNSRPSKALRDATKGSRLQKGKSTTPGSSNGQI